MAFNSLSKQALYGVLTYFLVLVTASNYTGKVPEAILTSESYAMDIPVSSVKSLTDNSLGNQLDNITVVDVQSEKLQAEITENQIAVKNQTQSSSPYVLTTSRNVSLGNEAGLVTSLENDNPDNSQENDFTEDTEKGTENLHSIVPALFSFFHFLNNSLSQYRDNSTSESFKGTIYQHEAKEWPSLPRNETDEYHEQETNSLTKINKNKMPNNFDLPDIPETTMYPNNVSPATYVAFTVPSATGVIPPGNFEKKLQRTNTKKMMKNTNSKAAFVYSYTTRSRGEITDFPVFSSTHHGTRQMKDGMWRKLSSNQMVMKSDWHSYDRWNSVESLTSEDVQELCKNPSKPVTPHPDSCARYINCSVTPDAVMTTYFHGHVMECPYPQLFSDVTLQCEDFTRVSCGERFEPKSPCEYRAHQCHESSHCVPCWVRFASCRGLSEGLNAWQGLEWEPFFVECHKERTVFQGLCDSSAVFSPITRACETPMSIPSKHGGWKPGCLGRRDGSYPDEFGRCDLYFLCQGQLFRGFHKCRHGHKFNPFTSRCQPSELVPLPCGDRDEDVDVCRDKDDGNYADIFGRCTHYFTCKKQKMAGLRVCPKGVFNVFTRKCDTSKGARAHLPRPCGELKNVCLHRADGRYGDTMSIFERRPSPTAHSHCVKHVVCQRGLTIAQPCSGRSGIGLDKLLITE